MTCYDLPGAQKYLKGHVGFLLKGCRGEMLCCTWCPRVCNIMAFEAVFNGVRPLLDIVLGSR